TPRVGAVRHGGAARRVSGHGRTPSLVGEGGLEPPTSCTQSRCASTAPLPGGIAARAYRSAGAPLTQGCTAGPRRRPDRAGSRPVPRRVSGGRRTPVTLTPL